jgi:Cu(I)/Ag(I) efflux system membrane fusion protein
VIADLFEQDLGAIRPGQTATVTVDAYPGASFAGKVDFIYPTVTQETRTAKVRIAISNPAGRLKPGMYAKVAFEAPTGAAAALAVPDSAVLDSGNRQIVLIDLGQGRFEPRDVKLGNHAAGYYEVLSGLKPGESVVVGANFLIDAESNLRAALQTFAAPASSPEGTR